MTDHKYTDDEVIRALECCAVDPNSGKFSDCKNCPLDDKRTSYCFEFEIQKLALDLINRQRAEIAEYQKHIDQDIIYVHQVKAEAVKEFAERIKRECLIDRGYEILQAGTINNLVKEFTESEKSCPDCKYFVGCEAACGGVPCDSYTEGDTNAK